MAEMQGSGTVPHARSSLLGREDVVARVLDLLRTDGIRLVTVTGLSGVGKTSVADEVARRVVHEEPVGVRRVRLDDGSTDPADLDAELASPSLMEADSRPPEGRTRLLLLDGFERHLDAAPRLGQALDEDPDLTLLVTSIVPLGLRGEHLVRLGPLPVPDGTEPTAADVLASPAAQLLAERIAALDPAFSPNEDDAQDIAELCRRLDGLPLAIELAAARCASSGVAQVLDQLGRRSTLDLLDRGSSDAADRHRDLRRTLEWTHDLLDPDERIAFRRLGAFVGPITWDDAVAVVSDCELDADRAWDALAGLVSTGLVIQVDAAGSRRLQMLASVRELAREHLSSAAESETTRDRHAAHFLARAQSLATRLWSAEQGVVRPLIHADADEYAAASDALRAAGRAPDAVRLLSCVHTAWIDAGRTAVAGEQLRSLLDATAGTLDPAVEAAAWVSVADLFYWTRASWAPTSRDRADVVLDQLGQAVEAAQRASRPDLTLRAMWTMIHLHLTSEDLDAARAIVERATELAASSDEGWWTTRLLSISGVVANQQGRNDDAVRDASQAIRRAHEEGDAWQVLRTTFVLAGIGGIEQRPEYALVDLEATVATAVEMDDAQAEGTLRVMLALSRLSRGDVVPAVEEVGRALRACRRSGHWYVEEICVAALVLASVAAGRTETGAVLHGGLVGVLGQFRSRLSPQHVAIYDFGVEHLRSELGQERFDAAVRQGAALGWRQLLEVCDELVGQVAGADPDGASTSAGPHVEAAEASPLTDREIQVLALIADGASNKDVAVHLGLRPKTVMHHASNIYRKLGVTGRAEAVSVAIRAGLLDRAKDQRDLTTGSRSTEP